MTVWNPLTVDGGGCLQTISFSGDGYLYMGSDTQGAYRTIRDATAGRYGQNSVIRNRGIGKSSPYHDIAAIWTSQFDPSGPANQVVYAMTSGGIMVSVDRMDTWSVLTTVPKFAGNTFKITGGNQDARRRPGRRHVAEDSSYLFVGTKNQGVMRSANHGVDDFPVKCQMNGAAPGSNYWCRSLNQDPDVPTTLYAGFGESGSGNGGLWKCTNAHATTPNFIKVSGLPTGADVEDIVVLDGFVYAALGTNGVWVASTSNTNSWTEIGGTGALDPTSWWCSLDVRNDGSGNHLLLCACSEAVKKTGDDNYRNVCKFTRRLSDGVITATLQMTNLASQLDVNRIQIPGGTRSWWNSGSAFAPGKQSFFAPCIRWDPDPSHLNDIYMAGTEGLYRWNSTAGQWQNCSNVMPQYLGHQIRGWSGGALWCTSDWGVKISLAPGNEDASTLNAVSPISSAESWAVSVSEDETKIYTSSTASGQKYTTIAGDVFQATPALNPTWSAMNLASAVDLATGTAEGGITAVGLCALNQSGGVKSLLAAVPGKGLWLWTSAAGWVLKDTRFCNSTGSAYMDIQHAPGSQYVYCFDKHDGIWRSNDYGNTWVRVYAVTSGSGTLAGKLAVDPTRLGSIWFTIDGGSVADGVYHITGAHTGTVGSGATLTGPVGSPLISPGPIGISDTGTIYVALQDLGSGSGLKYSANNGANWLEGNSDGSFSHIAARPEQISFIPSHSGIKPRILVSNGNVVAYADLEGPTTLPTSQPFNERQASQNFLGVSGTISMWNNTASPPSPSATTLVGSALFAEFEISDSSSGGDLSTTDTAWVLIVDSKPGTANNNVRTQIWAKLNSAGGEYGDSSHLATWTYSNTSAIVKGKLYEETTPAGSVQFADVSATAGALSAVASPASLSTGTATSTYQGGLMRGMIGAQGSVAFSSQTWSPTSPAAGDGSGNNATNVWNALRGTVPGSGTSSMATTMTYSGGPMTSWAGAIATFYAIPGTPLGFDTTTLLHGAESSAYSQPVTAHGGITPLSYSMDTGSDPFPTGSPAFAYNSSTGQLTGTPSVGSAGTYHLVFKVTDSVGATAIQAITLVIDAGVSFTGGALVQGQEGVIYNQDLSTFVHGGVPPYSFSAPGAIFPSGLTFSGSSGVLSGIPAPASAGNYSFAITVFDSGGHSAIATFTLTIIPAIPAVFPPPGGSTEPVTATLYDEDFNVIAPINFSTLNAQLLYNFVGSWSTVVPYSDDLWSVIKKFVIIDPDTGDVIRNGDCVIEFDWQGLFKFGGKIETVGYAFSVPGASSGAGTGSGPMITISGGDYLTLIANRIAFPDPTKSWPNQTATSKKTYTGVLETVIKSLVTDNVSAPGSTARQVNILDVVPTTGAGGTVSYDVKFSQGVDLNLMDIIRSLVATGGPMGVSLKRVSQRLSFDTFVPNDLTATAFFSPEIGNLTSVSLSLTDPTVTVALIRSGIAPLFSFVSRVPDTTTKWGRVEQFVDQSGETSNPTQATQAGKDALEQGTASPTLEVTTTDIPLLTFGRDYWLGDLVTVEPRGGDTYADLVSGVTLTVDPQQSPSISIVPTIGYDSDPGAIDPGFDKQLLKRVRRLERRLDRQIG